MDPCTLTTEYSDQTTPVVDIALENESGPQIPAMQLTLETERKMETQALQRERNRSRER